MTQLEILASLLTHKHGCTSMEIISKCKTTSPSKRISELRAKGWDIRKTKAIGANHHIFRGSPPKD